MLAKRYSGHTQRDQEGKDTMWVYQETKTEAGALVPRLPEREPLPMKEAEQTSHTPEPPQKEIPRRKRFRASRDCILLAAAYLFGTLMAGILLVIFGFLRLGALVKYIPYPVTTGFTTGIALLIFSSQIKDFFGLPLVDTPPEFFDKWGAYAQNAMDFSPATVSYTHLTLPTT